MERMIRRTGVHRSRFGVNGRYFWVCFFLMILASFLLVSCSGPQVQKSPAKGVYHIVKKGETAYSIARAYSISLQDLAEVNNIIDISSIPVGSVIFIPDANQVIDDVMVSAGKVGADAKRDKRLKDQKLPDQTKSSKPDDSTQSAGKTTLEKQSPSEPFGAGAVAVPTKRMGDKNGPGNEEKPPTTEKNDDVILEKGKLFWPVKGTVKTRFGIQPNKTYHNWIKITCPAGTQVRAAAAGTVIFSASLKDFGETIIIRHANNFATVYTHLKKRYVKADQNIKKGEAIALAGEIDESGDAYINFEIRLKGKARNPLFYMP
jgi:murein DD-endopeptidase MepM/ murein hydrolase activator NlpD